MARNWSWFIPHNLNVLEDWALLEACEAEIRRKVDEEGMSKPALVRKQHRAWKVRQDRLLQQE